jgi:hypothetical protein
MVFYVSKQFSVLFHICFYYVLEKSSMEMFVNVACLWDAFQKQNIFVFIMLPRSLTYFSVWIDVYIIYWHYTNYWHQQKSIFGYKNADVCILKLAHVEYQNSWSGIYSSTVRKCPRSRQPIIQNWHLGGLKSVRSGLSGDQMYYNNVIVWLLRDDSVV